MSFGNRYIHQFPIPEINDRERAQLAAMAEASMSGENMDSDIDSLVADLYGINLNISLDRLAEYA